MPRPHRCSSGWALSLSGACDLAWPIRWQVPPHPEVVQDEHIRKLVQAKWILCLDGKWPGEMFSGAGTAEVHPLAPHHWLLPAEPSPQSRGRECIAWVFILLCSELWSCDPVLAVISGSIYCREDLPDLEKESCARQEVSVPIFLGCCCFSPQYLEIWQVGFFSPTIKEK